MCTGGPNMFYLIDKNSKKYNGNVLRLTVLIMGFNLLYADCSWQRHGWPAHNTDINNIHSVPQNINKNIYLNFWNIIRHENQNKLIWEQNNNWMHWMKNNTF